MKMLIFVGKIKVKKLSDGLTDDKFDVYIYSELNDDLITIMSIEEFRNLKSNLYFFKTSFRIVIEY